jgi:hypothetical protein
MCHNKGLMQPAIRPSDSSWWQRMQSTSVRRWLSALNYLRLGRDSPVSGSRQLLSASSFAFMPAILRRVVSHLPPGSLAPLVLEMSTMPRAFDVIHCRYAFCLDIGVEALGSRWRSRNKALCQRAVRCP